MSFLATITHKAVLTLLVVLRAPTTRLLRDYVIGRKIAAAFARAFPLSRFVCCAGVVVP